MSEYDKFTLKAKNARALLRAEKDGILSTHSLDVPGYPFGSVTPYSLDKKGRPVILISDLAQHTKNIEADPKISLTITASTLSRDVQANARLTFLGDARKLEEDEGDAKERYLRKFPHAKNYFSAHNFFFYVLELKRARYIEGFGKIWWVEPNELELESVFNYAAEARVLDHMNADHKDALVKYCSEYDFSNDKEDYSMTGIDSEGMDLKVGSENVRIPFDKPLESASQAREVLVSMVKKD